MTPTWRQKQHTESLRAGLRSGKVVLGKEFAEPSIYNLVTDKNSTALEKANAAIQEAGLDPKDFAAELKQYETQEVGDIIERGGKRYRVVSIREDGEPMVDEI